MSGWVPREEYVEKLTTEQLKDFYIKSDPRKKAAPSARRSAAPKSYPSAVKGRGAYKADTSKPKSKKRVGAVPNKAVNQNFSSDYGSRLGSVIGEGVQSFANALGFGEYHIQQNSCMSMIDMGTSPPRVKNTNRGEAMVFNHREYLGDLSTGTGTPSVFDLQEYSLNIGNSTLFPFGAKVAENFQEWELRGMLVELKSLSSNTSTTLSLGSMFVAVDYNSLDPAPASKTELENLEYACSNKPSDSILMPVECARKNDVLTHLYIAVDGDYQGGDKRLYDIGRLFVGSFGCPAAGAPIAEIWITYEIALFKPHIHPLRSASEPGTAVHCTFAAVANNDAFGGASIVAGGNIDILFDSSHSFTLPPNDTSIPINYQIAYSCSGTGAVALALPIPPTVTDATVLSVWQDGTLGTIQTCSNTGNSSTRAIMIFTIQVAGHTSNRPIVDFGVGLVLPTSGTNVVGDLYVNQMPNTVFLVNETSAEKALEDRLYEEIYARIQSQFVTLPSTPSRTSVGPRT